MSTFWGKENKRGLKENTIDKKSCDLKSIICHEADCYDKLPVWSVRNILNLTKVDLESCGISVETIWWPDLFWYWDSCLPHVTLHVWLHQWRDSQYWHICFSPRPHPPRWLVLLLRLLPLPHLQSSLIKLSSQGVDTLGFYSVPGIIIPLSCVSQSIYDKLPCRW